MAMSTFGKNIIISLFGESHQEAIGITIHNFPPNIALDLEAIENKLLLRKGLAEISTTRREKDHFKIISGFYQGKTTGAPLTFIIPNCDINSGDYTKGTIRPSHSDLPYHIKYQKANDYRGGGHSSGRLTAPLVILGAISEQLLKEKGIVIASRIKSIGEIVDTIPINQNCVKSLLNDSFPVIDSKIKDEMLKQIKEVKNNGDSIGGMVETVIYNLPAGLGDPFFDSVESIIAHLIFSIPGVKGIEFGDGFDITKKRGSEANDQIQIINDKITFLSNHSGGINGGITNGEPVRFTTAIKPTSSIKLPQKSINIETYENTTLIIEGRHDPCIVPRALPVINALTSYAILDLLLERKF